MSGSVSTDLLRNALRKPAGIAIGLSCQFILLPFLGCLSATVRRGAWHCADNHHLFAWRGVQQLVVLGIERRPRSKRDDDGVLHAGLGGHAPGEPASVHLFHLWEGAIVQVGATSVELGVALSGLACGMLLVACRPHWSNCLNATGNIAGVLLILLGLLGSIKSEETVPGAIQAWSDVSSLVAVATPCACSILLSFSVAFLCRTLTKQEAIAVTVEVVYQNTGLATSILLATFGSERRAIALSVPMVYALIQTVGVPSILVLAWKMGYTYAPPTAPMLSVVCKNWQPGSEDVRTTMNPEVELIHDDDCEAATRKLAALESLPELP
eukprot:CAMPEP_0117623196 /NCGR_PEP_ID=MMETSP0784-20121206/88525_1 /TAXON_ID=39447 /ORGANISM="" /LENGTH=324 /DNA_ID=CAMNT_0005427145 /DNA_START=109 /DNA_END=1084 /DNA_ORIENTATION=-